MAPAFAGGWPRLLEFLTIWNNRERKQAVIDELAEEGLLLEPLADEIGKNLDPFDLICHVAFDQPPLTRREQVNNVRKRDIFTKYGPQAWAILEALLAKYQDEGVVALDDTRLLTIAPFDAMGTPLQLIKQFGTRAEYERAVHKTAGGTLHGGGVMDRLSRAEFSPKDRSPDWLPKSPSPRFSGRRWPTGRMRGNPRRQHKSRRLSARHTEAV